LKTQTDELATTLSRFGVRPVINARGVSTTLGVCMSDTVWGAATEANAAYCPLSELLDGSGEFIARLTGVPAARVTPGALAGIAMGIAACIAGSDGPRLEQLPDTTGMRSEVILQRGHRYRYSRGVALAGGRVVEVGTGAGTTPAQIEDAISERTAGALLPAHLDGHAGTVALRALVEICHRHGIPVFVDAAYMSCPGELVRTYTDLGADLACFSAKYFGGPSAAGFLSGTERMLDAVAALDFTSFDLGEYLVFGRAFKLDRWTIVATAAALEEWFAIDHDVRLANLERRAERVARRLAEVTGLSADARYFTREEELTSGHANAVALHVAPDGGRCAALEAALGDGHPRVLCIRQGEHLVFRLDSIDEKDDAGLEARIAEAWEKTVGR
jgi:D-glucosaminate-6-phosphate ammonia-lyase